MANGLNGVIGIAHTGIYGSSKFQSVISGNDKKMLFESIVLN